MDVSMLVSRMAECGETTVEQNKVILVTLQTVVLLLQRILDELKNPGKSK